MPWQPDPSFYPSPRMAAKAPAEKLAYVAAFETAHPGRRALQDGPHFELL